MSAEQEQEQIDQAFALHRAVTGQEPLGWYTGRCSANTNALLAKMQRFTYLSDSYADDLPYWDISVKPAQLIVPYTLDANDMRFATAQGFNAGDQFFSYLKDSFDCLYAEGLAGAPKMMSIGLHCRLIGRPGRLQALARFIAYIQEKQSVWIARRIDIAQHWQHHFPAPQIKAQHSPSTLSAEDFVAHFGGIFEHSPWIAQRAYMRGLGVAHNTAQGLHAALCIPFRLASEAERLKVLNAHPDLAGKLAQAKRLTAESTSEQASAGLDALSDAERERFEQLNARYVERFGFPFIIAVKGLNKAQILEAFERRINHSREQEFETACKQVEKIAYLRLQAHFSQ